MVHGKAESANPVPVSLGTEQPQNRLPRGRDLLNTTYRGFDRFCDPRNLISFLWLGPALALLILNFRGHIIGAGLNCGSHCRIDPFSTSQVQQIDRLDGTNRNVLGALQFVAKGLEVWFMYVAASLIYRSALHLSAKDNRLPVSMLLVYAEFLDLLYLKDLAVKAYNLAKRMDASVTTMDGKSPQRWVLYLFMLGVAALCVVSNLMGVATATLVIPGLQWIDINRDDSLAFDQILSFEPPAGDIIPGCEESQLVDRAYSCTSNLYGASLDALIEAGVASERQLEGRNGTLLPPVIQEGTLSFSPNVSESTSIIWVPNRQSAQAFSEDVNNYYLAIISNVGLGDNYPDSHRFNQSLQVQLQRVGPTIGLNNGCWMHQGARVINISEDQEVRCYARYTTVNYTVATKCIRWGHGWSDGTAASSASFTIEDAVNGRFSMFVTVYTTPRARYLRDTSCLEDNSCDWDRLFTNPADPLFLNISDSQQTYEYSMPEYSNSSLWCHNSAFLSFAAYTLNPSPVSNILQLAQLGVLHDDPGMDESNTNSGATLSIHPDWILAAWSVNGTDGVVPATRGSSSRFIDAFQRYIYDPVADSLRFNIIHSYATMQAVSLVPYTTTILSTAADHRDQRQREDDNPYTSATLTAWATVQLWKFGIDSRTKVLGVVVMIIGIVVVLINTIFWFESPKSPTQIIVAALKHPPPPDLQDEETGSPLTTRLKDESLGTEETNRASWPKSKYRRRSSWGFNHPSSPISESAAQSPTTV
ncbi:hypothetical protein BDV09DRAFT_199443 [Aspergillus tetrazonus]